MLDTRLKKYAGRRFANMSALVTSASRGGGVARAMLRKSWDKFMRFGPIMNENIQVSSWASKAPEDETKKRFHFFFFLSVTPKQFLAGVWTQQENICQQICSNPRLNNIYTPMALIATGSQLLCQNRSQKEARIYNYIDGIITNQACTQFTV